MAVDQFHERFGQRLRYLRRKMGWSQEELAARVQLSVGGISNLERGLSGPRLVTIERIAAALGIMPFELFWFSGNPAKRRRRLDVLEHIEGQLASLSGDDLQRVVRVLDSLVGFEGDKK